MNHQWQDLKGATLPVPMRSNSKYQRELDQTSCLTTQAEQQQVQAQASFSFWMTVGELIYALVVACLDIYFAMLSQYSSNPALIHYQATKDSFSFLNQTRDNWLLHWYRTPRAGLPDVTPPSPQSSPINNLQSPTIAPHQNVLYCEVTIICWVVTQCRSLTFVTHVYIVSFTIYY
jgi:hypothetical protein